MWEGVFRRRDGGRVSGGSDSGRLRWWVCFSAVLHGVMVAMLLVVPPSTARRDAPARVYTVDLVASPAPARVETPPPVVAPVAPAPPKPAETPREVETPPKEQAKEAPKPSDVPPAVTRSAPPKKPKKKVVKPKRPEKPKKKVAKPKKKPEPKVAKRKKTAPKKAVAKKPPAKKPPKLAKKQPRGKRTSADSRLLERLKERRIDDAVAVARERARLRRAARREGGGAGEAGTGTARNGGVVRGMEFLAYRGRMLDRIKDRWTWIGKRGDLEVTVGFGVGADGEIFGLKLLKLSGDASFDESVVRAVHRSSPLPPPPAGYVRDFAQVEVTFRPSDLDG